MTTSSIERDLIRDEGVRDRVYKDSLGVSTIGVGHNLDASGLCHEAILAQLRYDLKETERVLDRLLPDWSTHPELVQRVMLNLAFNLGERLSRWPIFLFQIESRLYKRAAANLRANSVYTRQVDQRAERLAILLEKVV